jgi:hypothetical protein
MGIGPNSPRLVGQEWPIQDWGQHGGGGIITVDRTIAIVDIVAARAPAAEPTYSTTTATISTAILTAATGKSILLP